MNHLRKEEEVFPALLHIHVFIFRAVAGGRPQLLWNVRTFRGWSNVVWNFPNLLGATCKQMVLSNNSWFHVRACAVTMDTLNSRKRDWEEREQKCPLSSSDPWGCSAPGFALLPRLRRRCGTTRCTSRRTSSTSRTHSASCQTRTWSWWELLRDGGVVNAPTTETRGGRLRNCYIFGVGYF